MCKSLVKTKPLIKLNPCGKCKGINIEVFKSSKQGQNEIAKCVDCGAKVTKLPFSKRIIEESWNLLHQTGDGIYSDAEKEVMKNILFEIDPNLDPDYTEEKARLMEDLERDGTMAGGEKIKTRSRSELRIEREGKMKNLMKGNK